MPSHSSSLFLVFCMIVFFHPFLCHGQEDKEFSEAAETVNIEVGNLQQEMADLAATVQKIHGPVNNQQNTDTAASAQRAVIRIGYHLHELDEALQVIAPTEDREAENP